MSWHPKAVIIIALPLFTICAASLYFYFKKDQEWDNYISKLNQVQLDVKVPKDAIGAVIGRGGANIKQVQTWTNTRINFVEGEDDGSQICRIRGSKEGVSSAENHIKETIAAKSGTKVFEMWVPAKSCGRIIGRCGESIKAISRSSNASVTLSKVFGDSETVDQKLVMIKGSEEQIAVAKSLIEEKIREDEVTRKNMMIPKRAKYIQERNIAALLEEKFEPEYERLMASPNDNMIQVYVSAVTDPTHFWLQLITPKAGDLDRLLEYMTEYYNVEENREAHKMDQVVVGEIVATKLKADGKWYRVKVLSIDGSEDDQTPETTVSVNFLDYGDSSTEKIQDLFELKHDFLSLRFQAIEVTMKGIAPKGGGKVWSEASISGFEDLVFAGNWKMMMVQVMEYDTKNGALLPCVRIYDPEGKPGLDIAKKMIENGLADPVMSDSDMEAEALQNGASTSRETPQRLESSLINSQTLDSTANGSFSSALNSPSPNLLDLSQTGPNGRFKNEEKSFDGKLDGKFGFALDSPKKI